MTRWEYLTTENIDLSRMNNLGEQGWELVVVVRYEGHFTMYWKRQL